MWEFLLLIGWCGLRDDGENEFVGSGSPFVAIAVIT
jgi:hypothetical protein